MLPRCLAAVEARRRRDDHRRHRLDRPHRRDRRVVRREACSTTSGPALLRRPQRLARGRDRRLDHLPRRRRGARRGGRRPAARAHRPRLARGVLPRRDQLHRRHRGRHRAHPQRAARVPQPPRVPLRGPPPRADGLRAARLPAPSASSTRSCGSSTTATSASCATRRTSRAATSSCSSSRSPRAGVGVPVVQPRLRVPRARRASRPRVEHFEKSWRMLETDPGRTVYPYVPTLANRFVTALRELGDLDGADRKADEALELFPGFTDLVFQQALDRARPRRRRRRRARCSSAASRWATRRRATRRSSAAAPTSR